MLERNALLQSSVLLVLDPFTPLSLDFATLNPCDW